MGRKNVGKSGGNTKRAISHVKKNNLKRHKLVKAGKLKPKSSPRFVEGGHLKGRKKAPVEAPEILEERERIRKEEAKQWEEEAYAEMGEMMDPEDLEYLRQLHAQKLKSKKSKKKAADEDVDEYESKVMERHNNLQDEEETKKATKTLLPIRTKDGKWVSRTQEIKSGNEFDEANEESEEEAESSSDEEDDEEVKKPISVVDILAKRRVLLTEAKVQIGTMSTSFLEQPEERLHILQRLCRMIGGNSKENGVDVTVQFTVGKLASASLLEIFKDTLPNYKLDDHEEMDKTVKLKKDTLKLHKFETGLLSCLKSYLGKLSKSVRAAASIKDPANHIYNSGKYSLKCLCELFIAHPNFNFTNHVVQFLVPYLNSSNVEFRNMVSSTLEEVFRGDKKGEVSFAIVKQINHHLKTKKKGAHHKIHEDLLMPLLSLKLYHLNNNQLTENTDLPGNHITNRKNAKGLSKKNKHIAEPILSKKEKKRLKERAKLDKQLLEAKGEESTQARLRFATDITNLLFAIYFRILKSFTSNHLAGGKVSTKLLHPVLNGLAKFGHLMSIEYFQDVLKAFKVLIDEGTVPIQNYEKLLCLKTVFAILSGQGDNLTIDPARFYTILNQILLELDLNDDQVFSSLKEREYYAKSRQTVLALSVLRDALIERRKKVPRSTVAPTLKNVSMSMLNVSPDATLEIIKFIRETLFVAHPQMAPLLLLEGEAEEDGAILPTVAVNLPTSGEKDPFGICNGQSLMWEAALIADHVSPTVAEATQELLTKKSAKPRKRTLPLTVPFEAKSELCNQESNADVAGNEINESSCFAILAPNLPVTVVNANKRMKKSK